jgi:hypothetical protein
LDGGSALREALAFVCRWKLNRVHTLVSGLSVSIAGYEKEREREGKTDILRNEKREVNKERKRQRYDVSSFFHISEPVKPGTVRTLEQK